MGNKVSVLNKKRLIIATLMVLVPLLYASFFIFFELVEKEVAAGQSQAALRDPWLAASTFLRKQGYTVVVDERLARLETLDEFSTLIVSRDDFLLTPASFNRVMAWVAKGGNLIIGFQDDDGYLAQGLYLSDDWSEYEFQTNKLEAGATHVMRQLQKVIEPLRDSERVDANLSRGAVAQAHHIAQDLNNHHAQGNTQSSAKNNTSAASQENQREVTADHAEKKAATCSEYDAQRGRCKLTTRSARMRAENAAARAAHAARSQKSADATSSGDVPLEHAWAQDYAKSNADTRTSIHFAGDTFDTHVDWGTYRTLIYAPPDFDSAYETVEPPADLEVPALTLLAQVGNDLLTHFMQFEAGDGTISVLIDTHIWRNDAIGRLDHAYFLWSLMGPQDQPVALLHGRQLPSLLSLSMTYLPEVLVASLMVLLAYFARRGWQIGPRIVDEYAVRRSLLEHVVASGVFLWEQGAQAALLEPVRRHVHHQLTLRMGQGFDVANDKDWSRIFPDLLPTLNSQNQKALRAALMIDPVAFAPVGDGAAQLSDDAQGKKLSPQEFYRHVRLLQVLRKVL